MFAQLKRYFRRRKYTAGAQVSRFLAPDIRRDVEIVDASEVNAGFVTARIRTWNVLYAAKGLGGTPDFEGPRRIAIRDLWGRAVP